MGANLKCSSSSHAGGLILENWDFKREKLISRLLGFQLVLGINGACRRQAVTVLGEGAPLPSGDGRVIANPLSGVTSSVTWGFPVPTNDVSRVSSSQQTLPDNSVSRVLSDLGFLNLNPSVTTGYSCSPQAEFSSVQGLTQSVPVVGVSNSVRVAERTVLDSLATEGINSVALQGVDDVRSSVVRILAEVLPEFANELVRRVASAAAGEVKANASRVSFQMNSMVPASAQSNPTLIFSANGVNTARVSDDRNQQAFSMASTSDGGASVPVVAPIPLFGGSLPHVITSISVNPAAVVFPNESTVIPAAVALPHALSAANSIVNDTAVGFSNFPIPAGPSVPNPLNDVGDGPRVLGVDAVPNGLNEVADGPRVGGVEGRSFAAVLQSNGAASFHRLVNGGGITRVMIPEETYDKRLLMFQYSLIGRFDARGILLEDIEKEPVIYKDSPVKCAKCGAFGHSQESYKSHVGQQNVSFDFGNPNFDPKDPVIISSCATVITSSGLAPVGVSSPFTNASVDIPVTPGIPPLVMSRHGVPLDHTVSINRGQILSPSPLLPQNQSWADIVENEDDSDNEGENTVVDGDEDRVNDAGTHTSISLPLPISSHSLTTVQGIGGCSIVSTGLVGSVEVSFFDLIYY
ncbi:hypothetical protein NE237_015547 [Protea cynaroides]|uniref:Uncharacterized protein n=1 Tax=Protea cynaroides TaxID=273540 RepID=A0A9Q0KE55_9MAGN|nr:hypothetical protein NE237_015547 [Protea cynaroides]